MLTPKLKYRLCIIILSVLCSALLKAQVPSIQIAYPSENDTIYTSGKDSALIFGQVFPVWSDFYVNQQHCKLEENGSFLAFVPIEHDSFTFVCKAIADSDTTIIRRFVYSPAPWSKLPPDSFYFDSTYTQPCAVYKTVTGDNIHLQCRATPGQKVCAHLSPLNIDIPLTEGQLPSTGYWGELALGTGEVIPSKPDKGMYSGSFNVADSLVRYDSLNITFRMITDKNDTLYQEAGGPVVISKSIIPVIAETKKHIVLRTGPGKSRYYFLPERVKLQIIGEYDGRFKVHLNHNISAWIDTFNVNILKHHHTLPSATIKNIRIEKQNEWWQIIVYTHIRVPYRIDQAILPQSLDLYLFNSTADTDWIRNLLKEPEIINPYWKQLEDNLYYLHIGLDVKQQWGYKAFYNENDNLVIQVKRPPEIAGWPFSPLKDLHILLDPGHWPDKGAIGPSGITERQVNLRLAHKLKDLLIKQGAKVTLIHSGEPGLSLINRIKKAKALNPDILLSLHHNALPDGVNPFKHHGTSTYYYHPQSYPLALKIQEHLLDEFNLPNYGLFWDNLAMCRINNTLSVLIEPCFLIYPDDEKLVRSESYYKRCSKAVLKSLKEFLISSK